MKGHLQVVANIPSGLQIIVDEGLLVEVIVVSTVHSMQYEPFRCCTLL